MVARTGPYASDRRARWPQGDATATGTAAPPAHRVTQESSASQPAPDHAYYDDDDDDDGDGPLQVACRSGYLRVTCPRGYNMISWPTLDADRTGQMWRLVNIQHDIDQVYEEWVAVQMPTLRSASVGAQMDTQGLGPGAP